MGRERQRAGTKGVAAKGIKMVGDETGQMVKTLRWMQLGECLAQVCECLRHRHRPLARRRRQLRHHSLQPSRLHPRILHHQTMLSVSTTTQEWLRPLRLQLTCASFSSVLPRLYLSPRMGLYRPVSLVAISGAAYALSTAWPETSGTFLASGSSWTEEVKSVRL